MANMNQLNPIARLNRSYDRERSEMLSESIRTYQVAAGSVIDRDGCAIVGVNEGGFLVVKKSVGSNADRFIGVSRCDETALPQRAEMQSVIVPTASPFTAVLNFTPLASSYLLEDAAGTDLVEGGGNDYTLAAATVTFTAAYAAAHPGAVISVRYKRTISVSDLEVIGGQTSINAKTGSKYGLITVASIGRFMTLAYDTSKNYAPNDQIYTGANGDFTSDNTSTIKAGRVWKAPAVGDPFLGIDLTPVQGF